MCGWGLTHLAMIRDDAARCSGVAAAAGHAGVSCCRLLRHPQLWSGESQEVARRPQSATAGVCGAAQHDECPLQVARQQAGLADGCRPRGFGCGWT